eukprot:Blabericola_migrator_1__3167@NODE_1926_length_3552_cov_105_965280_g1232_i0_p2_GENE_NODE_1926_length_3552_cov_105_965280_g1232_i0NODE_1926_length_3552_cov_105_965280_g1232_i0_p2_ORF_typecomplete_len330_score47_36AP2/PF00847_20/0_00045_NODE_1926_length_3552_cov_105_965280_g1232_i025133502
MDLDFADLSPRGSDADIAESPIAQKPNVKSLWRSSSSDAESSLSRLDTVDDSAEEPNFQMPCIIDIIGKQVRNQEAYEPYATDGCVNFVIGINQADYHQAVRNYMLGRYWVLVSSAEEKCLDHLIGQPLVLDSLFLELLAHHDGIRSLELIVLIPNRKLWESATEALALRLLRHIFALGLYDSDSPVHYDLLASEVYGPFMEDLISKLSDRVSRLLRDLKARGEFAPDYEPSLDEIERLSGYVPRCDVRGVGWNGSTKAWVASWLPLKSNKRVCATFSTRKYGYHESMKLAICQRVRSELAIYNKRRFPANPLTATLKRPKMKSDQDSE